MRGTTQHRRATSSGAVHIHLKNNVNILAREDRWYESGVNKSLYVKLETPSLNRGCSLQHYSHPPTMLYSVTSLGSLTAIHTWAHLALATHMKANWVNNPQVALTTQSKHMS